MTENCSLCFSADVYFGPRPASPPSEGKLEAKTIRHDLSGRFQLTIEPELTVSHRKGKGVVGGETYEDGLLEIQIRYVFALTDTEDDADGVHMRSITHCHGWDDCSSMMKDLTPGSDDLLVVGYNLLLEGKAKPPILKNMDLLIRRIQQALYDLVMEAKTVPGEEKPLFLGETDDKDEWMKTQLRWCLKEVSAKMYVDSIWVVLARLRELLLEHESAKTQASRE
ncbi:hypothetical protein PG997_000140 [Apiospora hydei]|uniref:Uncharacterized protein n=1 Tax=Apiospora hydei TaxID=1337664 RepID=A0ABR1X9R8_9PEZI